MPTPHVLGFSGGVVLEGSADTQRTDELQLCDAYDIGPRGALIAARSVADYVDLQNEGTPVGPWEAVYKMASVSGNNFTKEIAIGIGNDVGNVDRVLLASFLRSGATSPVADADIEQFAAPAGGSQPTSVVQGYIVTVALFPGVYGIKNPVASVNVFLVNVGARDGFAANGAPGLYVVMATPPSTVLSQPTAINYFDALGTGSRGEFSGGSSAKQLRFRGISAYNAHAMAWGHDESATDKEGPSRLMFSNLNNPLKWGNDNQAAAGTNRVFKDSDAIIIGDGGEIIRGGLTWDKRFWIGTDKQLHYVAGNGRDSFISDGANPIAKAENIIGAHCLIEGPDRNLYGVGDHGLWAFDGQTFERHHRRLRDFSGASKDWWDLIWTDRTRGDTYPGKTNADLVWMQPDFDNEQVVIGIPFCDATAGRGYGLDTVIIKFNTRTGGFARQVFAGVQYTAGDYPRRQRQYPTARFFGTATTGQVAVKKYGDPLASTGTLPSPLPKAKVGPYALFGPNGVGVYRKAYLTLAWEPGGFNSLGAWTLQPSSAATWSDVVWTGSYYVAVASAGAGNRTMRSADGLSWASFAAAAGPSVWQAIAYSPTLGAGPGRLVAVNAGDDATGAGPFAMYSDDQGQTWTMCTTPGSYGVGVLFHDIEWSPALGMFVAVGYDTIGVTGKIMSSTDGITFTDRATPSATEWRCIAWSPALAKFAALSIAGTAMTSSNGIAWANHAGAVGGKSMCWSPERALFVAVNGATNAASSPDGITWTSRALPVANDFGGVVWAPEFNLFLAVAISGTGDRAMQSADGFAWASSATPDDIFWRQVAYSPTLVRAVAVSATAGTGGQAMTRDAIAAVPDIPDMRFNITPYVDDQALTALKFSVKSAAPTSPAEGDLWLDVSGTDTNLGNATAGTLIPASADYIVKRYYRSAWQYAGVGGQKGQRATVPLAFTPARGTRLSFLIEAESSNRRWQLEGLGFDAAAIASNL